VRMPSGRWRHPAIFPYPAVSQPGVTTIAPLVGASAAWLWTMTGDRRAVVLGYWSGSPCRLLPVLAAAGFDVDFYDLTDPDVIDDLYADEYPDPVRDPGIAVTSVHAAWDDPAGAWTWAHDTFGPEAERTAGVFLCEGPAVVPLDTGRAVLEAVEAAGGGTVIGVDGGDQVPRWLSHWRRQLGSRRTTLGCYRSPTVLAPDGEAASPADAGAGAGGLERALSAAGYEPVSRRALERAAAASRRSGVDVLAGARWQIDDNVYFDVAAIISAARYRIDELPEGRPLVPWRLWDLHPGHGAALMYRADSDILGVETTSGRAPRALRFAVEFDTFGPDSTYTSVGRLDVSSGQLWIGDLRHCPDTPRQVRPGAYVVEVDDTNTEAFRLRPLRGAEPDT
jgi:hypothetical protein